MKTNNEQKSVLRNFQNPKTPFLQNSSKCGNFITLKPEDTVEPKQFDLNIAWSGNQRQCKLGFLNIFCSKKRKKKSFDNRTGWRRDDFQIRSLKTLNEMKKSEDACYAL